MALPQFVNHYKVDLALPLQKRIMEGLIVANDVDGLRVFVDVYNNGESFSLSDSYIKGVIIKADGTRATRNGSTTSNKASLIIPSSGLNVIGPVRIIIKAQDANSNPTKVTTLLVLQANVIEG